MNEKESPSFHEIFLRVKIFYSVYLSCKFPLCNETLYKLCRDKTIQSPLFIYLHLPTRIHTRKQTFH